MQTQTERTRHKKRKQSRRPRHTNSRCRQSSRRPNTGTGIADADVDGVADNPKQAQYCRHKRRWSRRGTDNRQVIKDADRADNLGTRTKGDTGSDSNNETRRPKIVSFSINNITGHGYSMQLTTEIMKLMKNLLKLKQPEATRATMTAIPTPNV